MDYSKDLWAMMDNIVIEGKAGKKHAEGHRAAATTYREYEMEGAAMLAEQQAEKLESHNEWLKKEWRRLKNELDSLPY